MNDLPEFLKLPVILASYTADVVGKRNLLSSFFTSVSQSRQSFASLRGELSGWTDDDLFAFPFDESRRALYAKKEASKATYEDSAGALVLIAAASLERLSRALGQMIVDRGAPSYIPGIHFARAVWELANQYKHLGEWRHDPKPKRAQSTMQVVALLVDDPLRSDAAAEFLNRAGLDRYADFEAALLSCIDGLSSASLVPGGSDGITSVTLVAVDE
jgi:hypothetical protein